jgi:hypothetical protein
MDVVMGLMIAGAVLAAAIGVLFSSEATFGVSLVAVGCLFAILGRIAQASLHQRRS